MRVNRSILTAFSGGLALSLLLALPASAGIPKVGEPAADFTLKTPAGDPVQLAKLREKGPVVLVVLRGWPGYQCPICTRQVGELIGKTKELSQSKAQVLIVYPGPAADLEGHAKEFTRTMTLPENFTYVIDPDYTFTKKYDLRWDAPKETAYPSTFVIDPQGKVLYAKSSRTHGNRAPIGDVLGALEPK